MLTVFLKGGGRDCLENATLATRVGDGPWKPGLQSFSGGQQTLVGTPWFGLTLACIDKFVHGGDTGHGGILSVGMAVLASVANTSPQPLLLYALRAIATRDSCN